MLAPPCKRHHRRWRKRCAVSAVTALADVTPCARTEHLLSLYDHVTRPKLCLECDSQATYTKFSAISYQGVLNISPPSISVAQWFSLPGYTTVSADTAPYLRLPTSQQSRLIRHLTRAYLSSWYTRHIYFRFMPPQRGRTVFEQFTVAQQFMCQICCKIIKTKNITDGICGTVLRLQIIIYLSIYTTSVWGYIFYVPTLLQDR